MSKPVLNADERVFVDAIAGLIAPWGWARTTGRVYGYLLLRETPVTLDEIAADLGISKSGACSAALELEQYGNASRHGEPGTKRIRYGPPADITAPLARHAGLYDSIARLADQSAGDLGEGAGGARLTEMAAFYGMLHDAVMKAIEAFRAAR